MLMRDTTGASQKLTLCALLWLSLSFLAKGSTGITVTCTDSEQCVLPCQFQSDGKGARIMWYRKGAIVSCTRYGDTSFVIGSNAQVDSYKGRTGLFVDQVLEGNAALTLRNVTPHDQDKYYCVTMTDKQTGQSGMVSVVLEAPVRRVDIGLRDDGVTCSSKGIYPRPSLVWSTEPPPESGRLHNRTTINETQQGFYDIQSTLKLKETNLNKTYVCRVATDTSHRTAFLKLQEPLLACPSSRVTVPCRVPLNRTSYNVTWTFGHWDQIMSVTVTKQKPLVKVFDRWKPYVSMNVQWPGGLTLSLGKRELQGAYSCEVNTTEETHISLTELMIQQDLPCLVYYISGLSCVLVLIGIVLLYTLKKYVFKGFVGWCKQRWAQNDAPHDGLNQDELQVLK